MLGVTGNFGLEVQNEAKVRIFSTEYSDHRKNLFQTTQG